MAMKKYTMYLPVALMDQLKEIATHSYSTPTALLRKILAENINSLPISDNEKEVGVEVKKEDKPVVVPNNPSKLPEAFKLQLLRRLEQLPDTFVFSFDGQEEKYSKLRLLEAVQNDTELGMKLFNYFEEAAS